MRKEYFTIVAVLLVATTAPVVLGQSTCVTCQNCPIGNEVAATLCPAGTPGCFRLELPGGGVNRGCASALGVAELNECQNAIGNCRICANPGCNAQQDFTRCFRCDSATGLGCTATQINNVNTQVCPQFIDECATMIVGQRTVRGCLSELQMTNPCNADGTCARCNTNFCNNAIFPANRLQCHHCQGNTDQCFNAIVGQELQRPCENYLAAGDECYTAVDATNQVFRGCRSDTGAGVAACAAGRCQSCLQHACNSNAARWTPTLSCVSCAANDVLCGWGFAQTSAVACTSNVFLGQTESCFTRGVPNGNAVRGCTLDNAANACAVNEQGCTTCNENACNRLTLNHHNCFQCTSQNNERCRNVAEDDSQLSTQCPGDDHQLADRGCFTSVANDGHVKRGCKRDMDPSRLTECRANDRCTLCLEDGCNDIPGGAMALKVTVSVVLVAFVALCANIL